MEHVKGDLFFNDGKPTHIFDGEKWFLLIDEIDKTKCPNCSFCIKNLQDDNDRLRKTNFKLEEENLSLKNKLKRM